MSFKSTRGRRILSAVVALAAGSAVALYANPATAHENGPPSGCGTGHACQYKDIHFGTKIFSPAIIPGGYQQEEPDFSTLSGVNDQISSDYNNTTHAVFFLYEHSAAQGRGSGLVQGPSVHAAHFETIAKGSGGNWNDKASSNCWFDSGDTVVCG